MGENRLRWFRYVERRNNDDIIKEIGEIRLEGSWRGGLQKKWMDWSLGKI